MIRKVDALEIIVKVRGTKNDDKISTTLVVNNHRHYILDIMNYCKDNSIDVDMLFVYLPLDTLPIVYMVHNDGSIERIDNYYN